MEFLTMKRSHAAEDHCRSEGEGRKRLKKDQSSISMNNNAFRSQ
jgi:hypothetical protein